MWEGGCGPWRTGKLALGSGCGLVACWCGAVLRLWARMRTGGGGRKTAPTTAGKLTARNKPACSSRWDLTSASVPVRWPAEREFGDWQVFWENVEAGDVFLVGSIRVGYFGRRCISPAPPFRPRLLQLPGPRRSQGDEAMGPSDRATAHSPSMPQAHTSPTRPKPRRRPDLCIRQGRQGCGLPASQSQARDRSQCGERGTNP